MKSETKVERRSLRRAAMKGLTFLDAPASPFFFIPLCPRGAVLPILLLVCESGGVQKESFGRVLTNFYLFTSQLYSMPSLSLSLSLAFKRSRVNNAGYVIMQK